MKHAPIFIAVSALVIWSFISHLALPLIVAIIVVVIWAYRADKNMWKTKPVAELMALVESHDWQKWDGGLAELNRRGEDITRFIPHLVSHLVSDSRITRAAAEMMLKDYFPQLKPELQGYSPSQDPAACRQKIEPLLTKYGI
jgi:hypothetical protein